MVGALAARCRKWPAGGNTLTTSRAPHFAPSAVWMSWIMDGHDIIDEWINSPQNSQLADLTVFAGDRSPAEVADEVLNHLRDS